MKGGKRKKILYIITKSNFGGAQRYVFDLATGIPGGHYEIAVALGGRGILKERLESVGLRTIDMENLGRDINIFKEIFVFFGLLKLFNKEKPDIIHLNSSKIGGLGALAGRLSGVKNIIFTGHGWAFNEDRNPIAKIIIFILHVITIILSDKTIAVSEKTRYQIVYRVPFLKRKMPVIYNGMERIDFVNKKDARNHIASVVNDDNLNKNSIWLGTVGELHHIKGHEYLLKSLSEMREQNKSFDFKLIIIGEGEEREKLEKLIKMRRLGKNIFLPGKIEDARRFLKAFDIFVFPSLSEAMPYALIEAGFAGLPIIASRVGGIPEIIKDGENGVLVSAKDIFELRDAIIDLLQNKKKTAKYSARIRDRVLLKFSREKMIRETINVYNS